MREAPDIEQESELPLSDHAIQFCSLGPDVTLTPSGDAFFAKAIFCNSCLLLQLKASLLETFDL